MTKYVFVDTRYPTLNLVRVVSDDPDLELEKVEIEVEDGDDIVAAVKAKLGL